jgi:hypothetical protein
MPKFTPTQLFALTADKDFQKAFAKDEVLDRLEKSHRKGYNERFLELSLSFGGAAQVSEKGFISSPSVGSLLVLSTLGSPYITGTQRRLIDVDIAIYVLTLGKDVLTDIGSVQELEEKAGGLCDLMKINRIEADEVISKLINESFNAFDMLPSDAKSKEVVLIDIAWYADITATVANVANVTAEYAGWSMPLTMAMYYVLISAKQKGLKLQKQTPKELMVVRMNELCAEWVKKKGYK